MKFCSQCGSGHVTLFVPVDDNRERHVCGQCDTIHYLNPKIVTGCLLYSGDDILLAKRAIEPRHGLWTIPAGFMELDETSMQGAVRECHEEALARPVDPTLYAVYSIPRVGQVYMLYLGELMNGEFGIGSESSDVRLFKSDNIPWDRLAFPMVEHTLKQFLQDRTTGHFPVFERTL